MGYVICSHKISGEIERNLIKRGVIPVKIRGFDKFGGICPLNYHPDMFCFNLEKNKWIFYDEIYEKNKNIIDKLNLDITTVKSPDSCGYPGDIKLNAAIFGDYLICNIKHTDEKIIEYANETGKNIIDVNQGYAKCSVCIVNENSIITSDISICKKALQNNIEVLLIDKGHINLEGYDYGFIGGCSGLITKNKLAFTGNIELHPDYENIKNFCGSREVEAVSLSNEKLYDYGSMFAL
ncbi:MAG: hypothetical protein FWH10_09085 [Oscillospiraceae bacterium]|nr:hypothetical protein [Oscillospiraceae bacterium]